MLDFDSEMYFIVLHLIWFGTLISQAGFNGAFHKYNSWILKPEMCAVRNWDEKQSLEGRGGAKGEDLKYT